MIASSEEVFLIPVGGRWLLHAPLHGVTSLLNGSAALELRRVISDGDYGSVSPKLKGLVDRLRDGPTGTPEPADGPFAPRKVSLLLTNDCNLRCRYCAPASGDGECITMAPEVCDAALKLQSEVVRRERLSEYSLYLHGGEPLLAWEQLRLCVGRANQYAQAMGVRLSVTAASNAYLPPDRARWVARHLTFVIVSIDGPPDLQDRLRPLPDGSGSFDVVARALDVFTSEGLRYGLRCNVDQESVDRMPEIAGFLCTRFRPEVVSFGPLVSTGRCAEAGLCSPDPERFARAATAAARVAREYQVEPAITMGRTGAISRSHCEVANDQFVVAPDGFVSSCFLVVSRHSEHAERFGIGSYSPTDRRIHIDQARLDSVRRLGVESIGRCSGCFCKWYCAGGCRIFHSPPGCPESLSPECEATRRLTLWQLLNEAGQREEADALFAPRCSC